MTDCISPMLFSYNLTASATNSYFFLCPFQAVPFERDFCLFKIKITKLDLKEHPE